MYSVVAKLNHGYVCQRLCVLCATHHSYAAERYCADIIVSFRRAANSGANVLFPLVRLIGNTCVMLCLSSVVVYWPNVSWNERVRSEFWNEYRKWFQKSGISSVIYFICIKHRISIQRFDGYERLLLCCIRFCTLQKKI